MSQWNLSVRLTGEGSDLSASLRDSAKEARKLTNRINEAKRALTELRAEAADDIKVRLDIDADHLRSDVTSALTSAGSGQALAVRLDLDAAHLRDEVSTALAGASTGQGLGVRLDVDAAHLRDEVSAALTTAGSSQGISVRLDVDTAHLRDDVSAALTTAGAGQGLTARLDVDAAHLVADVNTAVTAAGAGQRVPIGFDVDAAQLRSDVETAVAAAAAGQNIAVNLTVDVDQANETASALNAVARAARGAGDDLDHLAAHALAANTALRTLNTTANRSATRLGNLSDNARTLRTDLNDLDGTVTTLGGNLGGLNGNLGGLGNNANNAHSGLEFTIRDMALLATALIPVASSLAPIAAGFTTGGVAAAAYGIAIAGQISALTEAAEAQKKYEDAVTKSGARSEEAIQAQIDYQKILAKLPPGTAAAAAAFSNLKNGYQEWSDSLSGTTMEPLIKGMQLTNALLPQTSALVENTAAEADRFMTILGGEMAAPGLDHLNSEFTAFADDTLQRVNDGIVHLLRASDAGEFGGSLREFMDWAHAQGPVVGDTLENIGEAVIHLLDAGADVGVGILQVANALSKMVSAVPASAIAVFLQLAIAMKLVKIAVAGFGAARTMLVAFTAQLLAMQTAGAAVPGRLLAVRAAIAALSRTTKIAMAGTGLGLAILAISEIAENSSKAPPDVDKLTTSLRTLGSTGKTTGEAARAFGKDLSGLSDSMRTLSKPSNIQSAVQGMTSFLGMDSTETKNAKEAIDAVDKSLANLVQNGQADLAGAALDKIAESMRKQGFSSQELRSRLDDYKSALADQKFEQELAAQSMGIFGQAALDTQAALNAQKQSADGLRQSIQALNDVQRQGLGGMIGFEAAIDAATKAAKDNHGALSMTNGELNLNSEKARNGATALNDLAAKTEEAAAAARESGASWSTVNGIYERGRTAFLASAQALGLTKAQANQLANSILKIPSKKSFSLEMRAEDAKAALDEFIGKVKASPSAKTVTVRAMTADAKAMLETLGYKVKTLPDGRFSVTALTGAAISNIGAVQAARDRLSDKTIRLTTIQIYQAVRKQGANPQGAKNFAETSNARGGVWDYYASGGIRAGRVTHYAAGGTAGDQPNRHQAQIAPAGAFRVWGEPETQGEGYVPFRRTARPRSRAITEEIVRRLGGDPRGIDWYAGGGLTGGVQSFASGGFTYTPTGLGTLGGLSDAKGRVDDLVGALREAWKQYEEAVKELNKVNRDKKSTKKQRASARRKVANERDDIADINAQLGQSRYAKAPKTFDLSNYMKQLNASAKATEKWRANLKKIAGRGGQEVADLLESMGEEGYSLVARLAGASSKNFSKIVSDLQKVAGVAKATLADYTKQLNATTKVDATFQKNLATLASQGYGALATQLAGQGDKAAQDLAAEAVKSKSKASSANTAAKNNANQLSGEQLEQLVAIIAAVSKSTTGIHDVAATTGFGEDEIIAVANKAQAQIKSSLGSRATRFLSDLTKANKHLAYENGGIRGGIYGTRGGLMTFAEPNTGGEALIPLGTNKRRSALPVLADVAHRFGVGLTDAQAARPVVIVRSGDTINVPVTPVRTGATASDIGSQVGRSFRRARRGGVAARAA